MVKGWWHAQQRMKRCLRMEDYYYSCNPQGELFELWAQTTQASQLTLLRNTPSLACQAFQTVKFLSLKFYVCLFPSHVLSRLASWTNFPGQRASPASWTNFREGLPKKIQYKDLPQSTRRSKMPMPSCCLLYFLWNSSAPHQAVQWFYFFARVQQRGRRRRLLIGDFPRIPDSRHTEQ